MLNVVIAPSRKHASLTVFPLVAPGAPELPYTLMSDALAAGVLRITEVGSGSVPELHATNSGDATILVLDGEQLVGAKQNRTTNRSLLLAAHSETKIPVSCMEQGRWRFDSEHFQPTKHSSPSTVRRQAREVEASYAQTGAATPPQALAAAQGSVWEAIANHSSSLRSRSDTGALNELYDGRSDDIESWIESFPSETNQVGLLAFLGDRPLGMDLIGCNGLYSRLHRRLLAGYVMDALGSRPRRKGSTPAAAQSFLDQVTAARRVDSPSPGAGRYAVLSGTVIGGELTDGERAVHLSAFPVLPDRARGGGPYGMDAPISPPSRRRRSE